MLPIKDFMKLDLFQNNVPDATTLLHFRRLLEKNNLCEKMFNRINKIMEENGKLLHEGTDLDASIIEAPTSTKNKDGKIITSEVISKNIISCSAFLSNKLKVEEGTLIYHLTRLRYIDGKKYSITENYIPLTYFPTINNHDFSMGSLWNYMKENGFHPKIIEQTIEIRTSLEIERFYLSIEQETPVMVIENIATSTELNKPIDLSIIITNAYKSKLHFTNDI